MADKDRIHRWITQADLERMLADARHQGAEAMREAAAGIFDAPLSTPKREVLLAWAEAIRAMPIPEDKR